MLERSEPSALWKPIKPVWDFFAKRIMGLVHRGEDVTTATVILPFSVRYAFQYNGALFGPEEGLSLLDEKYGFLGVYVCLKFFEKHMEAIQSHLSVIFQGIRDGKNFSEYTDSLRRAVESLPSDARTFGTKSGQVPRKGFHHMCDGVAHVFNEHKHEAVPILVAYSGLLGAKGIIENMASEEVFYIYFPKNDPDKAFLRIVCLGNMIQVECFSESELKGIFHDAHIVMIDDTQKTGATFDRAEQAIRLHCQPKSTKKRAYVVVPLL